MSNILTVGTYYGAVPPPLPVVTAVAPSITMPEPMSYEFQVVEYMEGDRIAKVSLQVKRNTHDQYGNIKTHGMWIDVPRIKIPYVAPVV
jgi:hypothetical protein